jgi:hypothetical protein
LVLPSRKRRLKVDYLCLLMERREKILTLPSKERGIKLA